MGAFLVKKTPILDFLRSSFISKSGNVQNPDFEGDNYPEETEISEKMKSCEQKIAYIFKNKQLLLSALKHRSYLAISNEERFMSNERMEFLGDAVLDLVTTEYLYAKYPTKSEGELSKMKSILVSRKVLARAAEKLDLGNFVLINYGEEKSGGRKRQSILANTFESVLGAIYLDAGYERAEQYVIDYMLNESRKYLNHISLQNYKSNLLEYAQSKGWGIPEYHILSEEGPDHEKEFTIGVSVAGKHISSGKGPSKKRAEQSAARIAIEHFKENPELD